ncbi:MAG: acyl-CoA thioester hydrolase/BAAT C-terminal domain-containing protein [Campylobacterota bacterium]|nr:acyl-CoA thioester hydrolase/BAAT C-terminal domain-containing protein [Campylobacterota bacterium]
MSGKCIIDIQPKESLADQALTTLRISNLTPNGEFTIRAKTEDEAGVSWVSRGVFKSDETGVIDLSAQIPLSGTFTISDPSAILWSMHPDEEVAGPVPKFEKKSVSPLSIEVSISRDKEVFAQTTIERVFSPTTGIVREPVDQGGVVGTLFYPENKGPHPVVICLSGSGGGYDETRASLLAAHGYAAFAVAYFGAGSLPDELSEIPVEFFERAVLLLDEYDFIDSDKIAVYGYSKGAELALLLGSLYPHIKSVAAFSGSSFVWQGLKFGSPKSSWTKDKKEIAYLPMKVPFLTILKLIFGKKVAFLESYERGMQASKMSEEARICVEKINGPLFLVAGTDDQVWPAANFADMIAERLKHSEHQYFYQYFKEEGAGHLVGLPYFPSAEVYKNLVFTSGNNDLSSLAMIKTWDAMIKFFDKCFK